MSCARCVRRGIECKYTAEDDNRGTAPKSLVHLLQSRIKMLEEVLWLHSIDVNASIAELRTRGSLLTNGTPESTTPSLASQQVSTETDGALCSHGQLNFDDDGEARYFGSSSGRVELLQSADGKSLRTVVGRAALQNSLKTDVVLNSHRRSTSYTD